MPWPAFLALLGKGLANAAQGISQTGMAAGSGIVKGAAQGGTAIGSAAQAAPGAMAKAGQSLWGAAQAAPGEIGQYARGTQGLYDAIRGDGGGQADAIRGSTSAGRTPPYNPNPGTPNRLYEAVRSGVEAQGQGTAPTEQDPSKENKSSLWRTIQNTVIGPGARDLTPQARSAAFKQSMLRAGITALWGGNPASQMTTGPAALTAQRARRREGFLAEKAEQVTNPAAREQLEYERAGARAPVYPGAPQTRTRPVGRGLLQQEQWRRGTAQEEGGFETTGPAYPRRLPQRPVRPTAEGERKAQLGAEIFNSLELMDPYEIESFRWSHPKEYFQALSPHPGETDAEYAERMRKFRRRTTGKGTGAGGPPEGVKMWKPEAGPYKGQWLQRDADNPGAWLTPSGKKVRWDEED